MSIGDPTAAKRERLKFWSSQASGLMKDLRLEIVAVAASGVSLRMPFNPEFCADEAATVLHGGILTTLLDSAFGLANFAAIDGISSMGTLDLRVDYLRPAAAGAGVLVEAECIRQTQHIAFNTGRVYVDDGSRIELARGAASFALSRSGTPLYASQNAGG